MNAKIRPFTVRGERAGIAYRCPACNCLHSVYTEPHFPGANRLTGTPARPSLDRIVECQWGADYNGEEMVRAGRCSHFINAGVIEYTKRCTHELAGKAVPLPDLSA